MTDFCYGTIANDCKCRITHQQLVTDGNDLYTGMCPACNHRVNVHPAGVQGGYDTVVETLKVLTYKVEQLNLKNYNFSGISQTNMNNCFEFNTISLVEPTPNALSENSLFGRFHKVTSENTKYPNNTYFSWKGGENANLPKATLVSRDLLSDGNKRITKPNKGGVQYSIYNLSKVQLYQLKDMDGNSYSGYTDAWVMPKVEENKSDPSKPNDSSSRNNFLKGIIEFKTTDTITEITTSCCSQQNLETLSASHYSFFKNTVVSMMTDLNGYNRVCFFVIKSKKELALLALKFSSCRCAFDVFYWLMFKGKRNQFLKDLNTVFNFFSEADDFDADGVDNYNPSTSYPLTIPEKETESNKNLQNTKTNAKENINNNLNHIKQYNNPTKQLTFMEARKLVFNEFSPFGAYSNLYNMYPIQESDAVRERFRPYNPENIDQLNNMTIEELSV